MYCNVLQCTTHVFTIQYTAVWLYVPLYKDQLVPKEFYILYASVIISIYRFLFTVR